MSAVCPADLRGKKVLLASHGSRGDCQPFAALALALKKAGFDTMVFTNPDHEKLVTDLGVEYRSNQLPFKEFFQSETVAGKFSSNDFLGFLEVLGGHNHKYGAKMYTAYYQLLQSHKPDLVIAGTNQWTDALWIPLLFRIPSLFINLSNSHTMDPDKAPFGLPSLPAGQNRPVWMQVYDSWVDGLRKSYGMTLADLSGHRIDDFFPTGGDVAGMFGGIQPDDFHFLPYLIAQNVDFVGTKPTDLPRFKYTGDLILPAESCQGHEFGGAKTEALASFIASCKVPPVYIGWGSVVCISAKFMTTMAVRALKLTGQKAIILGGWTGLDEKYLEGEDDTEELKAFSEKNIFFIDSVAHEVLFPKCSVIVHHGGIGTTIAGIRSGRPCVVTPIFYDQFDSATMVEKSGQGIGTEALPTLTPQSLADAITTCLSDPVKIKTAQELGAKVRAKDGTMEATLSIIHFWQESIQTGKYWQDFDHFAAKKKKLSDPAAKKEKGSSFLACFCPCLHLFQHSRRSSKA